MLARLRDDPETRAYAARRKTQGQEPPRYPPVLEAAVARQLSSCSNATIMRALRSSRSCDRRRCLATVGGVTGRSGAVQRRLLYIVGRYIVGRMVRASSSISVPSYFILAALLDGPLHGYGIIKQAAKLSDGRVRLAAGTLYGALDRLAEEGLILADRQEVVEGRTRRYYRLTDHGVRALHGEAARMQQAARVVTRRSGSAATTPRLA